MTREDIFKTVDHTLLAQTATWEEIKEICDDAIKYQTASVCIPASYGPCSRTYSSPRRNSIALPSSMSG